MNMRKHTAGPWVWNARGQLTAGTQLDSLGDEEDIVIVETDGGFYPPRGADRALLAAAPDLFAAVRFLLSASAPMTPQQAECWSALQAAFAKATAESE